MNDNKDSLRIEFTERFLDMTDDEIEEARNLKTDLIWKFRRIYPRLTDIAWPAEIPNKKTYCRLIFWDGTEAIIKEPYDDVCNRIDDRENLLDQYFDEETEIKE